MGGFVVYPTRNEGMRCLFLLFLVLLVSSQSALAQPANDDCISAISIDNLLNNCSSISEFTNVAATPSSDQPACFGATDNDVWFSFTSTGSNVNIQVIGNQIYYPGGTARAPHMAIYEGNCGNLALIECATNRPGDSENLTNAFLSDLAIGEQYFLRVSAQSGTFQICLSSFDTKPDPNSDCATGVVLCDKSTFVVPFLAGGGRDDEEAIATCLDNDDGFQNFPSETNSAWYKWTAATSGTLSFTLFPNNPDDDLDFAVFEMDNLNDCGDKRLLRCMASGANLTGNAVDPFLTWDECSGPTGIGNTNDGLADFVELAGCQAGNDNFVDAIDMQEGVSYALLVNNYSQTGEGFRIEFGGTGAFLGPELDLRIEDDNLPGCALDSITVVGEASFGPVPIIRYDWNTSDALNGNNIQGPGPHELVFGTIGTKSIALTIETENGCFLTEIVETEIELSERMIESTISDETCPSAADGSIDINDVFGTIFSYEWSNGSTVQNQDNLAPGSYQLLTTDINGCIDSFNYLINSAGDISLNANLTNASCGGGADGSIELAITGPNTTYEVDWGDGRGFVPETTLDNALSDIYEVTVRSSDGCSVDTTILLNEIDAEPSFSVDQPSCFGFSDGMISLGGSIPTAIEWIDQNDFDDVLQDIPAGNYIVRIVDAASCNAFYPITVDQPDSLTINQVAFDISCNNANDGRIETSVSGGTPMYTFSWDNGANTESIDGLAAGMYALVVMDANGCTKNVDFDIQEPPALISSLIQANDNLCNGEESGSILFETGGGVPPYNFELSNGNRADTSLFENLPAGDYIVNTIDANGCVDSLEVSISEPDPILVSLFGDDTVRLGQLATVNSDYLSPGGVQTLTWSDTTSRPCGDLCDSITILPIQSGLVNLVLEDPNGCQASADFFITVLIDRPIFIPNAITANGDGNNDNLGIYSNLAGARASRVQIFDRWGEKVYEGQNQVLNTEGVGWDGTFNGEKLNPGVFVYQIEVEFIDGFVQQYTGEVNLIY